MESIRNNLSLPKSIHKSFDFYLLKKFISFRFKALIPLIIVIALSGAELFPQSCYHPFIDSVISQVSLPSLSIFERELTGEIAAVIGGESYRIISRFWKSEGNRKAGQYIFEKFRSYGLETQYWDYSPTGTNIIAIKPGTKFPNQKIIFCAHYDNYVGGVVPDTTYGADDNASGTALYWKLQGYSETMNLTIRSFLPHGMKKNLDYSEAKLTQIHVSIMVIH
jgi:hypothetical protein